MILEALIAVLLLFGFIIFIHQRGNNVQKEIPSVVRESQQFILDEIAHNSYFVNCVLNYASSDGPGGACKDNTFVLNDGSFLCGVKMDQFIISSKPITYDYACEICPRSLSCLSDNSVPAQKSVYTATTFLVGDGTNEKVIRLYFWSL